MTATVRTNVVTMAVTGERCRGCTRASACGKAPIRPMAKPVLLATFTPALAFAIVELTMARNTKNQNSPYSERARPSHDPEPELPKPENAAGPKTTSTA